MYMCMHTNEERRREQKKYICKKEYMYFAFSVLDDQELYEEQKYFSLEELQKLILFLNNFVYSCIWEETDKEREGRERKGVIQSCLSCLVLLLQRNQRKSFLPQEDSLLIK